MNFYDVVETFGTKVWCVGGAVRDEIMGYEPKDCDYVVEATKEEFLKNFPNAKQVGSHFPIFLFDKDGGIRGSCIDQNRKIDREWLS